MSQNGLIVDLYIIVTLSPAIFLYFPNFLPVVCNSFLKVTFEINILHSDKKI